MRTAATFVRVTDETEVAHALVGTLGIDAHLLDKRVGRGWE